VNFDWDRHWWLIIILAAFAVPIVQAIFEPWNRYLRYRRQRDAMETLRVYAAQGREPPPAVLAALGGSCTVPVGAWAQASVGSTHLTVHGLLASGDGRTMIRMSRSGDDPTAVGIDVARALVIDGGGYGLDGFDSAALRQSLAPGTA
jgi:hypothetical protein